MSELNKQLSNGKFIIGMVHLKPLPGSAKFQGNVDEIYQSAIKDAKALEDGGASAILIENHFDQPFLRNLTLEQLTTMAAVSREIKVSTKLPVGIDVAFNQFKGSLAIAKSVGADFVRIPVFVDRVDSLSGIYEPSCSEALKYRKQLDAENILILADIQVKETILINKGVSLEESAKLAERNGADAVIVTGTETGGETPVEAIIKVKKLVQIPVLVGSGVNSSNVSEQLKIANGAIVGSSLKSENNEVDQVKVQQLVNQI